MKKILILSLVFLIIIILIHPAPAARSAINHSQNYTAVLTYGQTPYQTGFLSKSNITGWTWWDTSDSIQDRKQHNIIFVNILKNGTPTPITGLAPPSWIRTDESKNSGSYSYKADYDDLGNYSNNMDIWHFLDDHSTYDPPWKDINITNSSSYDLIFYTYYKIEQDRDFGYVKVSTDKGETWTELANYTGTSGGWIQQTIDLTAYAGQEVIIAFNFKSDNKNVDQGWYIDDITIEDTGISSTSLQSQILNWIKSLIGILSVQIFSDGAEDPVPGLSVTVEYPTYNHSSQNFSKVQRVVDLVENYQSQGLYYGFFYYENTSDTYTGEYLVKFNQNMPDTSSISVNTSFNTTLWGCQATNCHDTYNLISDLVTNISNTSIHPNGIVSPGVGGDCQLQCHSPYSSQFLTATPAHLHEIRYGHEGGFIVGETGNITIFNVSSPTTITVTMYSESDIIRPRKQTTFNIDSHSEIVNCKDCHTSFIHDNSGIDEHLMGQSEILFGTNISSTGVHANSVTCEDCHGNLSYPVIPNNQFSLTGTIGSYDPTFTSYLSNTKTYIINVQNDIDINVSINNPTFGVTLTLIGPIDNTSGLQDLNTGDNWEGTYFVPSIDGSITFRTGSQIFYPLGGLKVSDFTDPSSKGTWIARLFSWSSGSSNFTITSNNNNPIVEKPVIHIPWNCSECHNPSGTGNATTVRPVPPWDNNGPSFAHTDHDNDTEMDVPCRSCHNSFHEISIQKCVECHNAVPSAHPIEGQDYFDLSNSECMLCHGDPHDIGPGGGANCTDCHLEGGSNTNWSGPILNRTGFFNSVHFNITGKFNATNYTQISMVCWGCHVDYEQQLIDQNLHTRPKSELPECEDCHFNATPLNGKFLRKQPPVQILEHQPLGEDIQTNISTNCTFCHNNSLGIPIPTTNVKYKEAKNYVSHYADTVHLMTPAINTTDCMWCHVTETNNVSWGSPTNPMNSTKLNHTPFNITDSSGCYPCHISSRIMVNGSPPPGFTFHNRSMAHGAGKNCVGCHDIGGMVREKFQIDVQAMNRSDAIHYDLNRGAAATLDPNNVRCWACHGDGNGSEAEQPDGHPLNFLNPKSCSERDCHNVNQSIFNEPMVYEHFKYVDMIDENISTAVDCQACHKNSLQANKDKIMSSDLSLVSHYGSTPNLINTSSCIYCHLDEDNGKKWGNAPDPNDNISSPSDKEWETMLLVGERWHLGNRYFLLFEDIAVNGESAYLQLYHDDTLLDEMIVFDNEYYSYEGEFIDSDGDEVTATVLQLNFTAVFRGRQGLVMLEAIPWKRIHKEIKDEACWACHMDYYGLDKKRYIVLDEDKDRIYYAQLLLDFPDKDTRDRETLTPRDLLIREGYSKNLKADGSYLLTAEDVDIRSEQVLITITREGKLVEEDIFGVGEYLEYKLDLSYNSHIIDDVVIIRARVESVFHGFNYDAVILTDVRIISDNLLAIDDDEKLGGYNTSLLHIGDIFSVGGLMPDTFHVPPLNEGLDGGPDCVMCHDTSAGFGIAAVDAISTQLGGHAELNKNATSHAKLTDTIDKACWACHGDGTEPEIHPPNYLYPRLCQDCHVELNEPTYGAVDLSDEAHGQVEDCNRCHAADYPGLHVINVFDPLTPYILRINVTPEIVEPGQQVYADVTAMSSWFMKVEAIEYFIDIEGPLGTGILLAPGDGSFDDQLEEAGFILNTTELELGNHTIYVRSMQRDNKWGPSKSAVFSIEKPVKPVKPVNYWWLIIILSIIGLIIILKRVTIFGAGK